MSMFSREPNSHLDGFDQALGWVELPWETFEPRPAFTDAMVVTQTSMPFIARFFRQNGKVCTTLYDQEGSETLTVRDPDTDEVMLLLAPGQVLIHDGAGHFSAVSFHEFRRDHRPKLGE